MATVTPQPEIARDLSRLASALRPRRLPPSSRSPPGQSTCSRAARRRRPAARAASSTPRRRARVRSARRQGGRPLGKREHAGLTRRGRCRRPLPGRAREQEWAAHSRSTRRLAGTARRDLIAAVGRSPQLGPRARPALAACVIGDPALNTTVAAAKLAEAAESPAGEPRLGRADRRRARGLAGAAPDSDWAVTSPTRRARPTAAGPRVRASAGRAPRLPASTSPRRVVLEAAPAFRQRLLRAAAARSTTSASRGGPKATARGQSASGAPPIAPPPALPRAARGPTACGRVAAAHASLGGRRRWRTALAQHGAGPRGDLAGHKRADLEASSSAERGHAPPRSRFRADRRRRRASSYRLDDLAVDGSDSDALALAGADARDPARTMLDEVVEIRPEHGDAARRRARSSRRMIRWRRPAPSVGRASRPARAASARARSPRSTSAG